MTTTRSVVGFLAGKGRVTTESMMAGDKLHSEADARLRARPVVIDVESLDARQRAVHDAILNGPRGVVEGPLRVWLLSPDLAERAQALGAFCRYSTSLAPDLSELAILVMGSYWKAGFEWCVHAPIAQQVGVPAAAIEAIRTGNVPVLESAQLAVYRFARTLLERHRVDAKIYEEAVDALGRQGVVELVGILGYYSLISMTINAFEVAVPEGAAEPFEAAEQAAE